MGYPLSLIAFVLLFVNFNSFSQKNDYINRLTLKSEHLKGPVRSVKSFTYLISDTGKSRQDTIEIKLVTFDRSGNSLSLNRQTFQRYNSKTEPGKYSISQNNSSYTYDSLGNLIELGTGGSTEWKCFFQYDSHNNRVALLDGEGMVRKRYVYTYSTEGKKIDMHAYDETNHILKQIVQYDERGNDTTTYDWLIENLNDTLSKSKTTKKFDFKNHLLEECDSAKGQLSPGEFSRTIYEYNKSDSIIQKTSYVDGTIQEKTNYSYDSLGNCIEINKLHSWDKYTYDLNKNILEYSNENRRLAYKYDNKNNLVEVNLYKDGNVLRQKTTYLYNKENDQIESRSMNMDKSSGSSGSKSIITYAYDKYSNSISTTIYENNYPALLDPAKTIRVTVLEIAYY